MKRLYFLPAACLLLALPLSAQENLKMRICGRCPPTAS